jgi:predicted enzyme related to lactoylglutathione lyase
MAFRVDTVFVWVTDLPRAVEWYELLGIAAGPNYGDWQSMETSSQAQFALHRGARGPGAATAVVAFGVEDLEAEISRLAAVGIMPADEAVTDTGVAKFITYNDPDGNDIQLLERYG